MLDIDLAPGVARLARPLHSLCLARIPQSDWAHLYAAIVCGATPPPSLEREWFQVTGLYHLLVVSGSHLIFISHWLKPLAERPRFAALVTGLLGIYALMCLGAPPVVRAFAQILLARAAGRFRWQWSAPQLNLITGVLVLSLFPAWVGSLSFGLSWLASLLCSWAAEFRLREFWKVSLIQTGLAPAFGFAGASPLALSIAANWLLGPILGRWLFACALSATVFPPLVGPCDFLWRLLTLALAEMARFGAPTSFSPPDRVWLLFYVLALNALWLGLHRWRAR